MSITAIVKTQGSDTKLIGQMQPYYEAQGPGPTRMVGRSIPTTRDAGRDGENGV
jgi:hypothetical protein